MSYRAIEQHLLKMVQTFQTTVLVPDGSGGFTSYRQTMFPDPETVAAAQQDIPTYLETDEMGNPVYRDMRMEIVSNPTQSQIDNGEVTQYDRNERYRTTGIAGIAQYELLADPKDNMCFIEASKPDDVTPMGFGRRHDRFYSVQWNPMFHLLFRPQPDDEASGEIRLENFNMTLGEKINEFLDQLIQRPTLSYEVEENGETVCKRYSESGNSYRNSSQILYAEPVVSETNIFRGESGPYNFYVGISIVHKIVEGYQLKPII